MKAARSVPGPIESIDGKLLTSNSPAPALDCAEAGMLCICSPAGGGSTLTWTPVFSACTSVAWRLRRDQRLRKLLGSFIYDHPATRVRDARMPPYSRGPVFVSRKFAQYGAQPQTPQLLRAMVPASRPPPQSESQLRSYLHPRQDPQ